MQAAGSDALSDSSTVTSWARRTAQLGVLAVVALLSGCAPMQAVQPDEAAPSHAAARSPGSAWELRRPTPLRSAPEAAQEDESAGVSAGVPEVDQQGLASWYGPGFHGRKTANGERYNQYELTAAHRQYAFNTQLCVRNTVNGKTVVVRVNDRGPFVGNRVIDLSKAAAEEIGMLDKGIKKVEIYKLGEGQEDCPAALLQAQG